MKRDADRPYVPVTFDRARERSDADGLLSRKPSHSTEHTVLVPVTRELLEDEGELNVRRFLRTAIALARDKEGRVLLCGVEAVGSEAALETIRDGLAEADARSEGPSSAMEEIEQRRSQLAEMAAAAREIDTAVSVTAILRVAIDVQSGILDVLDGDRDMTVLVLRGAGLEDGTFLRRDTIDVLLDEAPADVFVENVGCRDDGCELYVPAISEGSIAPVHRTENEEIESILLAIADGPHAALAAEGARAIAQATDARIKILHVVDPAASGKERSDGNDLLRFTNYVTGPDVATETELKEAADTTAAIIEAATAHDLLSIGAPTDKSRLARLVFDPVDEKLTGESGATVLMARDSDKTSRSLYYRWKQGIEALEDETESES